jgi:hypothetical protein
VADLITAHPLIIYQGDDQPLVWTLTTAAGGPVDLTGYTAFAQVRERAEATSPVLHEWSATQDNVELSVPDSTVSLEVVDSETWTWTSGVYDLHVVDFAGRSQIVDRGPAVLIPVVSRLAP